METWAVTRLFKTPKTGRIQGQRCPCPHLSRQKARRWLRAHRPRGFLSRPTAPYVHDAWAPGPDATAQRPRLRVAQPASRAAPRPEPRPEASPGKEGGRRREGPRLSRPQRPPPAGRPSRPAPTCGARDLPEPPAARPQPADPHRPGAAATREGPCKLSALETRCRAGERRAGLDGEQPIPAHGRAHWGGAGSGLRKPPIDGARRARPNGEALWRPRGWDQAQGPQS